MFFFNLNFDLILIGIAVIGITILGFVIFLNNRRSITNKTFFLFSLMTVMYGIANYSVYHVQDSYLALWLLRFTIFFAVWHAFSFFQLFYVFPKDKLIFPQWYKILLLPIVFITSFVNLSPFVFVDIPQIITLGQVPNPERGPLIALFGIVTIFLVGGGIYLLTRKAIISKDELDRKRLSIVLTGTILTFFFIIAFNFIFPVIFNILTFIPYAPIFMFPFIACTSYAIIKYKLFNVKVIATELITFSLWIFILIRALISNSLQEASINGILFIITVGVGILLIRSVMKEVEQRDQIDELNKELRRAFELEKSAKEDMAWAYKVEKKAKEDLVNLDKTKNQFLLTIQHHLRTPLTIMMGYSDLMLTGHFGKLPKKIRETMEKTQAATQNLIKMVNDFLDVTQFQLGKNVVVLRPQVELMTLIQEIVDELKFKAAEKKIDLALEKPTGNFFVKADTEKLKTAIYNVIDNAIRYTVKGKVKVTIIHNQNSSPSHQNFKVISSVGASKLVVISVKDTGMGIPKEKLVTLFEHMFERGEAVQSSTEGKGLGLYLTAQIIKAHNGRVWAESEGMEKGSTFYIELPLDVDVVLRSSQAPDKV